MESMAQKAAIAKVEVLIGRINEFRESYTADWRERCYKVIITEIQDIFREYFGIPEGSTIPDGKPKDLAISSLPTDSAKSASRGASRTPLPILSNTLKPKT